MTDWELRYRELAMMLVAVAADYFIVRNYLLRTSQLKKLLPKRWLSGCGSGALSHPKETSGFRIIWDRDGLDFHRVSIF